MKARLEWTTEAVSNSNENSPAKWTFCTANCAMELTGPNLSDGPGSRSRDKLSSDHWGYPWSVIGLSKRRSGW